MSDLLNKASLVMVPSGYKEDTVYSVVPSDGSGDMAFTRASNGTRVNSAGLVEVCPWNLLEYSEDFGNASWGKVNSATITTNSVIAPNGVQSADTLNTANGASYIFPTSAPLITNGAYTYSVYAKIGTQSQFQIIIGTPLGGWGANFNLSSVTATPNSGAGTTASIESVGNGWYRCILTATIPVNTYSEAQIGFTPSSGTIYIWGAQLNIGATAKPYFPTTDRLNVPRLTYQNGGGGCPSLLLEKQATNYLIYNTEIDNAAWVKARSTVTANATTSPDGTQNADGVFVNSDTNTNHEIFQYGGGGTEGWSAFFKANGYNYVYMFGSADPVVWFDLQNGVVGTAQSGVYGKITNYGNGWYRCEYYKNSGTNSIWGFGIVASDATTTIASPDTSKGVYFWGAQAEAGLHSTSMIYTTSSSATRVEDACSDTATLLSNKLSYSVFLDFYPKPLGTFQYFFIQKNSSANAEIIWGGTSGGTDFAIYDYTSGSICNVAINDGNRHKIVLSQASGKIDVFVDGAQVATQKTTSATGFYYVALAGYPGIYKINELVIMSKITDADAIALTTL